MKDMIPLGTGNSRFLKSVENFKALYPTYDAFVAALVAGTLPVDFNGVNPAGVSQIGTALNKLNLLKDSTAEMYGLDGSVVPDDVLADLGKYKLHWWKKYLAPVTGYQEQLVSRDSTSEPALLYGPNDTFTYSKSISINQETGEVSLADRQTFSANGSCSSWSANDIDGGPGINEMSDDAKNVAARISALAPCYILSPYEGDIDDVIYYLPEGATSGSDSSTVRVIEYEEEVEDDEYGTYWVYGVEVKLAPSIKKVSSDYYTTEVGEPFYLRSTDRNAYPDNGTVDGYHYIYLGVPLDNAVIPVRVVTGTYAGTGKYGRKNPNSLTFDFVPKCLIISDPYDSNSASVGMYRVMLFDNYPIGDDIRYLTGSSQVPSLTLLQWGTTIKWYSGAAYKQLNNAPSAGYESTSVYRYMAIG